MSYAHSLYEAVKLKNDATAVQALLDQKPEKLTTLDAMAEILALAYLKKNTDDQVLEAFTEIQNLSGVPLGPLWINLYQALSDIALPIYLKRKDYAAVLQIDPKHRAALAALSAQSQVVISEDKEDVHSVAPTSKNHDAAIELNLKKASYFYDRGNDYHDKGDYDRAIEAFDDAIRLDPKNTSYFNNRGSAYQNKGDYGRAIEDFDAAIKLDPKKAFYFHNRGNTYYNKGDYDRAIEDFDDAIRLDPKNTSYFNNRGSAYHNKGDYDQAIKDSDAAIKLDPKKAFYFHNRGSAYHNKGDYDQAIKDSDAAIKLNPKDASYFNSRGVIYFEKGDYDRAIEDYNTAIRLDSNSAFPHLNLCLVYCNQKNLAKAEDHFDRARCLPDASDYSHLHAALKLSAFKNQAGTQEEKASTRLKELCKELYLDLCEAVNKRPQENLTRQKANNLCVLILAEIENNELDKAKEHYQQLFDHSLFAHLHISFLWEFLELPFDLSSEKVIPEAAEVEKSFSACVKTIDKLAKRNPHLVLSQSARWGILYTLACLERMQQGAEEKAITFSKEIERAEELLNETVGKKSKIDGRVETTLLVDTELQKHFRKYQGKLFDRISVTYSKETMTHQQFGRPRDPKQPYQSPGLSIGDGDL